MKIFLPFIALLLSANNVFADISVMNVKARPSMGNLKSSAIYMDIKNTNDYPDLLTSVTGSIASHIELHKTVNTGDIHQMVKIDKLAIPANSEVMLAPHGLHIMLMDLKENLEIGKNFPITLHFEKAGKINAEATVTNINK